MQVRFGTSRGLELLHMLHWSYVEEVTIPVPPEPPITAPPVTLLAHAAAQEDTEAMLTDLPPSSSAPPEPVAVPLEDPPPETTKTLTVYMVGLDAPLVFEGDEAAALLGIFVSQSGSLT